MVSSAVCRGVHLDCMVCCKEAISKSMSYAELKSSWLMQALSKQVHWTRYARNVNPDPEMPVASQLQLKFDGISGSDMNPSSRGISVVVEDVVIVVVDVRDDGDVVGANVSPRMVGARVVGANVGSLAVGFMVGLAVGELVVGLLVGDVVGLTVGI